MSIAERVLELSRMPGVFEEVQRARGACEQLRWHPALRRRIPEAAAESRARGAAASAALDGAEVAGSRLSLAVVRDVMRGAVSAPPEPDPAWRTLLGAVRVTAAAERTTIGTLAVPAQTLARLHMAAGSALLPATALGRPRGDGQECREGLALGEPVAGADVAVRLSAIAELIAASAAGVQPTQVLAALVHAEMMVVRPFVAANGLVARATERAILQCGGVDPTGVAVIEAGHSRMSGAGYRGALAAYATGERDGVAAWLVYSAQALGAGADEGRRVADAVLSGKLAG